MGEALQQFSCRSTTVETLHAKSLQSFGYGDVVHQFEKRCKPNFSVKSFYYLNTFPFQT
jgi:hypothetical protein